MEPQKKKKCSGKRIGLILLVIVLSLVLAAAIAIAVALSWLFGSLGKPDNTPMSSEEIYQDILQNTDPVDPNFTGIELNPEEVWQTRPSQTTLALTTPVATQAPQEEKQVINILLIGQDRRPGEGRQRSDAMILCSINLEEKTLVMTSFQRDTYVRFPDGHRDYKLNAAYQWGGMPLLDDTLELNYGIHIDGNVEVDFTRFAQIIDMAGGVSITLTQAESDWLLEEFGRNLSPGTHHLNGEDARLYCSIRKIDNDFGRTNRQRKVLISLLESCRNSSPTTLMDLLNSALPLVATDMSEKEIVSLATQIIPILGELKITSQSIPAKDTYYSARVTDVGYVLVPDFEANRAILRQSIYGEE